MLDDETLRDGLQSPSVRAPSIDQKIQILHLLDRIGVDTADIGLPGAGPHVVRDVERLAREIVDAKLRIQANCAARTVDRGRAADCRHRAADRRADRVLLLHRLEPDPPLRGGLDRRSPAAMHRRGRRRSRVRQGLTVMYVTEDTTRSDPETLRRLFTTAIRAGASRICIADTVGHATPAGARAVVRFARRVIDEAGGETSASTGTAIAIATWARSTAWPRSRRAPRACTARSSASASGSATRRWTC